MTPDQLDALAGQYRRACEADWTVPLALAENALRYVHHHPDQPLPVHVSELLLSALARLHQVERAARGTVSGRIEMAAGYHQVRSALRGRLANGSCLDDEAGR